MRDAGVAAEALAFIEMHGTGTPAGDPVEAEAVGQVLGQRAARAAADRLGQDQYRPSRAGLRDRRAVEGDAGAGARHAAALALRRDAEPRHSARPAQFATRRRGRGDRARQICPGSIPSALAAERARDPRASSGNEEGAEAGGGSGAAAADDLGAQRAGASRRWRGQWRDTIAATGWRDWPADGASGGKAARSPCASRWSCR